MFFLEQFERRGGKQTTAMRSSKKKKKWSQIDSFPKPLPQGSRPPQADLEQRTKLISSKLDEENLKVEIKLAA